jgi:hypothetical protein
VTPPLPAAADPIPRCAAGREDAPRPGPRTKQDDATLLLRAIRERMSRDERFRAVWEPLLLELER